MCWVSDTSTEPTPNNFVALIAKICEYYTDSDENVWLYATPITPIKSLNQTVIDYVNGEVITEFKND